MSFLLCCGYFCLIGVAGFLLGRLIPKRFFTWRRFPYRAHRFEREGAYYLRFKINRWQSVVPDMSRILPGFLPKKSITGRPSDAQLTLMLRETCIAEWTHVLLCVAGLVVPWKYPCAWGWALYAVYALLGNLPFIMIQRYNRPRLLALLNAQRRNVEKQRKRRGREEKRILILSCNTGEGHNSCAKAIQEAFQEQGIACEIADALAFVSPRFSKFLSWGHVFVYRHAPHLFRLGYRYSEKHPSLFHRKSLLYWRFSLGSDSLASCIVDQGYDAVISTHVFASLILTEALKRHQLHLHTSFVATDYTSSPSMADSDLDCYFIPDPSLVPDFTVGHITPDRIISSGIPVRQEIYQHLDKAEARRRLGIPKDHKHLLVMCGSMGCGPIEGLIARIQKKLQPGCTVTVVCGTNEKLYRKLSGRYKDHPQIQIFAYRRDVSVLMDSADLYLTKPGGLSVTEAAVKNLPMVMIDAVAGCEEYNKNFFVKRGMGVTADYVHSLAHLCMDILTDDAALLRLQEAGRSMQRPNAPHLIRDSILDRA